MDDFEEKKWFVYLSDHHEGPFSLSEIRGRMNSGDITRSHYVWGEGMEDWQVMTEVDAFGPLLRSNAMGSEVVTEAPSLDRSSFEQSSYDDPIESTPLQAAPAGAQAFDSPEPQKQSIQAFKVELDPKSTQLAKPASAPQKERPVASKEKAKDAPKDKGKKKEKEKQETSKKPASRASKGRVVFFALLLSSAGLTTAYFQGTLEPVLQNPAVAAILDAMNGAVQPLMLGLTSKFPALSRWISPIPALEDVSPADQEELRNAASANLEKDGPKIAVALSNGDLLSPSFYVASNLPDGTVIHISAEGVPDTLLNQLSFTATAEAVIEKKLGRSQPLRAADQKPVPRGQYEIYAIEAEKQPPEVAQLLSPLQPLAGAKLPAGVTAPVKLLATKSLFLGGLKDTTYAARLKEFHDKLRQKATTELNEVKQFALSLENSLNETHSKFKSLYKPGKAGAGKKKQWEDFNKHWSDFQTQVKTAFAKWTPEVLDRDFFYGMLYKLLQQLQQAIENVHGIESSYFAGGVTDTSAFDIKLGQAAAMAESSVAALKAKISQAEKLQPTPNGMPRRDGL